MMRWNTMASRCHGSLFTFHEQAGRQTSERRKEEASKACTGRPLASYIHSGETSSKDLAGRAAKGRSWARPSRIERRWKEARDRKSSSYSLFSPRGTE